MPAKVELRDGYGWTGGTVASDEHGTYVTLAPGNIVKTIYCDHTRHGLQFVSRMFRLYNKSNSPVNVTITPANVIPSPAQFTVAVPAQGSCDVLIEGYAGDTDPTVTFNASNNDNIKIYLTQESGY